MKGREFRKQGEGGLGVGADCGDIESAFRGAPFDFAIGGIIAVVVRAARATDPLMGRS